MESIKLIQKLNMQPNINKMAKQKEFIELRDLWGQHAINGLRKNHRKNLVQDTFEISTAQKVIDQCSQKNITRGLCLVNMCIPMTCFLVTNPIIIKISNKISKDKLGRKINVIKMRFR